MAVFAVIASTEAEKLKAAITTQYGANHYEFSPSSWFVPDTGTTKDVADKLGLSGGAVGAQGVVLKISAYSGWAGAAGWTFIGQQATANG